MDDAGTDGLDNVGTMIAVPSPGGEEQGGPAFFAHSFSLSLLAIYPGPRLPNISFDFVREFSRNLRLKNLCLSVFIRG